MQITTTLPTARAASLTQTMAKHFAHKITVVQQGEGASLSFDDGRADLAPGPNGLAITVHAQTAPQLDIVRDVVERHLLRFAVRDQPEPLVWTAPR